LTIDLRGFFEGHEQLLEDFVRNVIFSPFGDAFFSEMGIETHLQMEIWKLSNKLKLYKI
jgi:hypothetical protein